MLSRLQNYIPYGTALEESAWRKRHALLLWLLLVHVPGLLVFALAMGRNAGYALLAVTPPLLCAVAGRLIGNRRVAFGPGNQLTGNGVGVWLDGHPDGTVVAANRIADSVVEPIRVVGRPAVTIRGNTVTGSGTAGMQARRPDRPERPLTA